MADSYVESSTTGWFSRILNSFIGVLLGIVMFFGSFYLLYWNEGRVDISKIAQKAPKIQTNAEAPAEANGQLVSITGEVAGSGSIGDSNLTAWAYLAFERKVEMFAWDESKHTKTVQNLGGSETTETTYTYDKKWMEHPESSSNFRHPEWHENPSQPEKTSSQRLENATIWKYDLSLNEITLPPYHPLSLSDQNITVIDWYSIANPQYLFAGSGSIGNPQVGDLRISYGVIANPLTHVTVFWRLDAENHLLTNYIWPKDTELYRMFESDRASALLTMHQEYTMMTWIFRGVGFLLMWMGLSSVFGPLSVILDFVPIFGSLSRGLIGGIAFVISLILSTITIIISMILHNLIALAIILWLAILALIGYVQNRKQKSLEG